MAVGRPESRRSGPCELPVNLSASDEDSSLETLGVSLAGCFAQTGRQGRPEVPPPRENARLYSARWQRSWTAATIQTLVRLSPDSG